MNAKKDKQQDNKISQLNQKLKNAMQKIKNDKQQNRVADVHQVARRAAAGIPYVGGQNKPYKPNGKFGLSYDELIRQVKSEKSLATKKYIAAVLDPQYADPARIPTLIGFPSCTTKLTYEANLTPNAQGNICIIGLPQLGYNSSTANNRANYIQVLAGATYTADNNYIQSELAKPFFTFQDKLPSTLSKKWRVVGFSMRTNYVGNPTVASGYFVNAFLPFNPLRSEGVDTAVTKYGPSSGFAGCIYKGYSEDTLKSAAYSGFANIFETCEVLYTPRDDVDLKYMNTPPASATFHNGAAAYDNDMEPKFGRETSHMVISGFGLPTGTPCIRLQVDVIIEYIASPDNWVASEGAALGSFDPRAFEAINHMGNSNYATSVGGGNFAQAIYNMDFGDYDPTELILKGLRKGASALTTAAMATIIPGPQNYYAIGN